MTVSAIHGRSFVLRWAARSGHRALSVPMGAGPENWPGSPWLDRRGHLELRPLELTRRVQTSHEAAILRLVGGGRAMHRRWLRSKRSLARWDSHQLALRPFKVSIAFFRKRRDGPRSPIEP
jgi:hypothetical protein